MITTLHLSTYIQTADVNPRFESALGQTTHESIWKAGLKATEILNQFFKQAVFPAYNTESNQISRFEAQKAFDLISDFFITHSRDTLATEASSMKALNAVSLDPVEGFGKFQDIESVYNPSKNEIRFFNNRSKNADQDEVIFVN
ncbi:hypothetical protein HYV11_02380, partial [Candidatus Dependentiae bacterium]|nr:hypothetical protein [Candidatus Dependentiae bacterium]